MKLLSRIAMLAMAPIAFVAVSADAAPVFSGGTIFIEPDIITPQSRSLFTGAAYAGMEYRYTFDRRVNNWVWDSVYLFDATFSDGRTAEIQVNREFASVEAAAKEANYYGHAIGQLPTLLRSDLETVWIHQGVQGFGGGNNNLLIHTGQADLYVERGILEETFIHEATHTSLDAYHATSSGWLAAQAADGRFISPYAEQNPLREDLAETFLMWLAVRYFADSMDPATVKLIEEGIPNRLAYLDAQNFDLYPYAAGGVPEPATWAMMIMGFGLVGFAARRRAAAVVTTA